MFATIGHTFELMKMSWRVLMKDRELIWFPIFSGIGVAVLLAVFFAIASATGTLDRITSDSETATAAASESANIGDIILVVLVFFLTYFITIFFNSALISAALERLRGGDPNISSGLSHAASHIHNIIGWAIISATVGLILMLLRNNQRNGFARFFIDLIGGVWEFMTFFVVPVLVSEGLGPFAAIKRSSGLVRQTWGRQITANFGFLIVYFIAVAIVAIPAVLIGLVVPIAGIVVGVILGAIAMATVQALEGIFKAALYEYAMGERPQEFDLRTLQTAYRADPQAA